MQINKIAALEGGASVIGDPVDKVEQTKGSVIDSKALGMALPAAAALLASIAGFKAANTLSDKEAEEERQRRIAENMNRLGKTNLQILQAVRKEAELKLEPGMIGTFLNPFQGIKGFGGKIKTPAWFKPSMAEGRPTDVDHLIWKTLAVAGTYGSLAFGLKYLMSAMQRKKEQQEGNKKIEESVRAAMPIISPDPSLRDVKEEEEKKKRGLTKNVLEKDAQLEKEALIPEFAKDWYKEWSSGYADPEKGRITDTLKAAAILAAVSAFGGGAYLGKKWADDRDEARQRFKAAEKALKRQALTTRPPAVIGDIDPKVREALNKHIMQGRAKLPPRQATSAALEEQEIDPTDTLSRNIATV